MSEQPTIILISTGLFQEYIIHNIRQLLLLSYEVIIITEKKYFNNLKDYKTTKLINSNNLNTSFDKQSKLDKKYRNGFWNNASKRLFLLYECMKKYNLTNCIHLENDVLLYSKFNTSNFDKNKVYLTMDSKNRCIPGIIYVPNHSLLDSLINNYNYSKNDMTNMSFFIFFLLHKSETVL